MGPGGEPQPSLRTSTERGNCPARCCSQRVDTGEECLEYPLPVLKLCGYLLLLMAYGPETGGFIMTVAAKLLVGGGEPEKPQSCQFTPNFESCRTRNSSSHSDQLLSYTAGTGRFSVEIFHAC